MTFVLFEYTCLCSNGTVFAQSKNFGLYTHKTVILQKLFFEKSSKIFPISPGLKNAFHRSNDSTVTGIFCSNLLFSYKSLLCFLMVYCASTRAQKIGILMLTLFSCHLLLSLLIYLILIN
jgi:hypothetical protein